MDKFNPVNKDKQHFKYLGWGVDCRKGATEWEEQLMSYGGPQFRDLAEENKNINLNQLDMDVCIKDLQNVTVLGELGAGAGANLPLKLINADFQFGLVAKSTDEEMTIDKVKKRFSATLQNNTSSDPGIITVKRNDIESKHSKFELVLCEEILEYIAMKQEESKSHSSLGKNVKDLQGENAIAKLRDFTKEKQPLQWQLVADACTSFIENIQYTHYVYSITFGTKESRKYKENQSVTGAEGKAQGGGEAECVEIKANMGGKLDISQSQIHQEIIRQGSEDGLEVIEVKVKPLHSLISDKSPNLKSIMEKLLESYGEITHGKLSGPYTISCQNKQGKEVYWYADVDRREIYGTRTAETASKFYIKYFECGSQQFCIVHKKGSGDKSKLSLLRFKSDSLGGLQLVYSAKRPDISFMLVNQEQTAADLPPLPAEWSKGSYFIKLYDGGLFWQALDQVGFNTAPYVGMVECKNDPKHKYKTISKKKISEDDGTLMLFTMNYQYTQDIAMTTPKRYVQRGGHGMRVGGMRVGGIMKGAAMGDTALPGDATSNAAVWDMEGMHVLKKFITSGAQPSGLQSETGQKKIPGISNLLGRNYSFPHTIKADELIY